MKNRYVRGTKRKTQGGPREVGTKSKRCSKGVGDQLQDTARLGTEQKDSSRLRPQRPKRETGRDSVSLDPEQEVILRHWKAHLRAQEDANNEPYGPKREINQTAFSSIPLAFIGEADFQPLVCAAISMVVQAILSERLAKSGVSAALPGLISVTGKKAA